MAKYKLAYTAHDINERLREISQLKDDLIANRQIGSENPAPQFEWDGNRSGKESVYTMYGRCYRISDTPMDLNGLTHVEGNFLHPTWEMKVEELDGYQIAFPVDDSGYYVGSYMYACSVSEDVVVDGTSWRKGLYLYGHSDAHSDYCEEWVSFVQFVKDGTTTSIDPKYLPKGGVGYTEPNRVYEFDGNPEGHVTDGNWVKISDDKPSWYDLISLTTYADDGGEIVYYPDGESENVGIYWNDYENGLYTAHIWQPYPTIRDEVGYYTIAVRSDGFYVCTRPDRNNWYVPRVEFKGIVHTVAPEYIPEEIKKGLLPTAQLATEFWGDEWIELPPEDCDALNAAVAQGAPVIVAAYFLDGGDGECFYEHLPFSISYEGLPSDFATTIRLKATFGATTYLFVRTGRHDWWVQTTHLTTKADIFGAMEASY